jgi:hypothetical protein
MCGRAKYETNSMHPRVQITDKAVDKSNKSMGPTGLLQQIQTSC